MKNQEQIKNKKIFILGLGKSGQAVARLCARLGAEVTANEASDLTGSQIKKELTDAGIRVVDNQQDSSLLSKDYDCLIKSPGIPYEHPTIQKALEFGMPVITDVELAYLLSQAPIAGITGSNGKTTVTHLVGEMMKQSDKHVLVAGNIGTPVSEVVEQASSQDYLILELSSFQLLGTQNFKPKYALVTNLYSAHLDYHGTRENYVEAKKALIKNQDEDDFFVYNAESTELCQWAEESKALVIPFSNRRALDSGAYVKGQSLYFNDEKIINLEEILLPGEHNLENICAAVCMSKVMGADNESIRQVLSSFAGVPHRLQYIGEVQGRSFYNDSKATNQLASQQALRSFQDSVIWICGGLDRQEDLTPLIDWVKDRVSAMFIMGENAEAFRQLGEAAQVKVIERVESMADAVQNAYSLSKEGDTILLSPASASWDSYPSFEARGEDFIEYVEELKGSVEE